MGAVPRWAHGYCGDITLLGDDVGGGSRRRVRSHDQRCRCQRRLLGNDDDIISELMAFVKKLLRIAGAKLYLCELSVDLVSVLRCHTKAVSQVYCSIVVLFIVFTPPDNKEQLCQLFEAMSLV